MKSQSNDSLGVKNSKTNTGTLKRSTEASQISLVTFIMSFNCTQAVSDTRHWFLNKSWNKFIVFEHEVLDKILLRLCLCKLINNH